MPPPPPEQLASPEPYKMRDHVRKIRYVVAVLTLFAVTGAIILLPLAKVPSLLEKRKVDRDVTIVHSAIAADLLRLQKSADGIAASGVLNRYIQNNDSFGLLGLLNDERGADDIGFLAAADKEGIILAQTENQSLRGGYIFDTTHFGALLYKDKKIASVEETQQFPLSLMAGATLSDEGDMTGAIVAGQLVDSAYARKLKNNDLDPDTEIIFYSNEKGIVGHTFDDEHVDDILHSNFDVTVSKIDLGAITTSVDRVLLNHQEYSMRSMTLPGPDGSRGGFIILVKHNVLFQYAENVILAIIATLVFVLLLLFALNYSSLKWLYNTFRQTNKALLFLSVLPFILFFFVLANKLEEVPVLDLREPVYPIYNSKMVLVPESGTFTLPYEQRVSIQIVTGGEPINAAHAEVLYDPSKVRVVEILTTSSFCDEGFILEKSIDNVKGRVSVQCGVVGGFSKRIATVADLVLQPLGSGGFTLEFGDDTQVLAHDGLGTDVLREAVGGHYSIAEDKIPDTGDRLLVFSTTHPNSERWYNKGEIQLSWKGSRDDRYAFLLDRSPDTIPSRTATTSIDTHTTYNVTDDGIYYFHIQAHAAGGAALPTAHYKIKIDTTPPEAPTIKASNTDPKVGEVIRLEFSSKDETSGLQQGYYYVSFSSGILLPVRPPFFVAFPDEGPHTVTIRVFDNAGNASKNAIAIQVGSGGTLLEQFLGQDFFMQLTH